MVCPICVTTAIVANAPAIAAGVAATAAAVQGKKVYQGMKKEKRLMAKAIEVSTPPKMVQQDLKRNDQ